MSRLVVPPCSSAEPILPLFFARLDPAAEKAATQRHGEIELHHENVIGAFSELQAEALSGVSINQLRRWDADGFFNPSYGTDQKGVPFGRIYSFRDIVALRVLNILRNEEKIPLSHLREVSDKLSHLGEDRWTCITLYVLGKKVVIADASKKDRRHEVVSGQHVLDIPLKVVIANTRKAVAELNRRESKVGEIVHARFVAQNEPVVSGTRILVASIQDFARAGFSNAQIRREYPELTDEDIRAALAFDKGTKAA